MKILKKPLKIHVTLKLAYFAPTKGFGQIFCSVGLVNTGPMERGGEHNRILIELSFTHVTTKTRAFSKALGFFRILFCLIKCPPSLLNIFFENTMENNFHWVGPRPIQSESCDVRPSVCVCVPGLALVNKIIFSTPP